MYESSTIDKKTYADLMEAIKQLNREKRALKNSEYYLKGVKIKNLKSSLSIKGLVRKLERKKEFGKIAHQPDLPTAVNNRDVCNYFSKDRIAIYTCIVGKYDDVQEPLFKPDNCDYYAITDCDIPENSIWTRIPIEQFVELDGFTPTMKNRYFKFHPHVVFPDYKYSIYVDGNFRICSDLTEHVNRISKYGLSCFRHSKRNSAYDEVKICEALKKETPERLARFVSHLHEEHFPDNYGLLACDILVREHNKKSCIEIMDAWWKEFTSYVHRDQISLPFVLYKKGILIDEIATLGGDVHKEYSFEIVLHNKFRNK